MSYLSAIVAADLDGGIGLDGKIPWTLPADMMIFRRRTLYQPVLMGRATFESIPEVHRPLKERHNLIITSRPLHTKAAPPFATRSFPSVAGALEVAERLLKQCPTQEIIIAGGSQLYEATWDSLQFIYLTRIHRAGPADRKMPAIEESEWVERFRTPVQAAVGNLPAWSVHMYERRQSTAGIG